MKKRKKRYVPRIKYHPTADWCDEITLRLRGIEIEIGHTNKHLQILALELTVLATEVRKLIMRAEEEASRDAGGKGTTP